MRFVFSVLIYFIFIITIGGCDVFLNDTGYKGKSCTEGGICLDDSVCVNGDCINKCDPGSCNDHGECEKATGACNCNNEFMTLDCSACQDGYIDYPDCRDDPCEPDPCNVHGTCNQANGSCTCDEHYSGITCYSCADGYIDYPDCRDDPCEPDPCNDHGSCDSSDGSCTCDNAFMTADCSACQEGFIEYPDCRDNPCKPDPCNGHGLCSQADGSCECDNAFMTEDCSACQAGYIDYPDCRDDPCEPDPCHGHGSCDSADGSCTCDNAFMTEDCSACFDGYIEYPDCRDDPCEPDPCNGHGTCNSTDGSCTCDNAFMTADCSACLEWYAGYPDCQWDGTFPEGYCNFNQCWPVPPTGQDVCYNWADPWEESTCPGGVPASCGDNPATAGCGQDAQYADNARSFTCYNAAGSETPCGDLATASEDEVVTDSLTGLMWQRTWAEHRTWQEALDYCGTTLNEGSGFSGFTDWRLPNPHELLSIVDNSQFTPAIDNTVFPGTPSSYFWSSSSLASDTRNAWFVDFGYGFVYPYDKTNDNNARCVCSGPEDSVIGSFDHLIISGSEEQIVTDVVTGLIWQKAYVSGKTWQEALAYCEELDYANQTDWRLPDKNELSSLVNYEIYSPASDFPDMPMVSFWSSSSLAVSTNYAWYVDFSLGNVYYDGKAYASSARCVRAGP